MGKTVCIYPQDATTDFLRPLCNHVSATFGAVEVGYDTSGDDDPMEIIFDEIKDAETIFFLGHGMSTCLYASILDNVELFNKENVHHAFHASARDFLSCAFDFDKRIPSFL